VHSIVYPSVTDDGRVCGWAFVNRLHSQAFVHHTRLWPSVATL